MGAEGRDVALGGARGGAAAAMGARSGGAAGGRSAVRPALRRVRLHSAGLWLFGGVLAAVPAAAAGGGGESSVSGETIANAVLVIGVLVILLSLMLESMIRWLKENVPPRYEPLLERLFGEIAILGLISIAFFLAAHEWTSSQSLLGVVSDEFFGGDDHVLVHLFEQIHFTVFLVAVLYCVLVFLALVWGNELTRRWRIYEGKIQTPPSEEVAEATTDVTGLASSLYATLGLRRESTVEMMGFTTQRHLRPLRAVASENAAAAAAARDGAAQPADDSDGDDDDDAAAAAGATPPSSREPAPAMLPGMPLPSPMAGASAPSSPSSSSRKSNKRIRPSWANVLPIHPPPANRRAPPGPQASPHNITRFMTSVLKSIRAKTPPPKGLGFVSFNAYILLRFRFIDSSPPTTPYDFHFAEYLGSILSKTLSSVLELDPGNWLVAMVYYCIFWGLSRISDHGEMIVFPVAGNTVLVAAVVVLHKMVRIRRMLSSEEWALRAAAGNVVSQGGSSQSMSAHHRQSGASEYSDVPRAIDAIDAQRARSESKARARLQPARRHAVPFHVNWRGKLVLGAPPTDHEKLFWFQKDGVALIREAIRTLFLLTVLYIALFLTLFADDLYEYHAAAFVLSLVPVLVVPLVTAMAILNFALVSSIEGMKDDVLVKQIIRRQKTEKSLHMIQTLYLLTYYVGSTVSKAASSAHLRSSGLKSMASSGRSSARRSTQFLSFFERMFRSRRRGRPSSKKRRQVRMRAVPAAQEEELKRLFGAMDLDNDGRITRDEIESVMRTMGHVHSAEEISQIVDLMAGPDGTVAYPDFQEVMSNYEKVLNRAVDTQELVSSIFQLFDQDNSGKLAIEEVTSVFSKLGQKWEFQDVLSLFAQADLDGDGEIDREEFAEFVESVQALSVAED